jgi:hypothetical protein
MEHKPLAEEIEQMKSMAEILLPFTFPVVDFKVEQDVLLLKQRTITVDGYDLLICYSKADYNEYFLESLQVQSAVAPFLPFTIVCKLGRAFLGSHKLSYIEFFRNNKKVYCWTLKSIDGRPLPPDENNKPATFEGFDYSVLQPGSVDLF